MRGYWPEPEPASSVSPVKVSGVAMSTWNDWPDAWFVPVPVVHFVDVLPSSAFEG
ncbi:MAG TPA: hypothetical protein VHJ20_24765 [Polyangia bacterium]|nr:hypothetical protein [Polyangia bacterium]